MDLQLRKKIQTSILMLSIPIILGVTGYMTIERFSFLEALYMTVITVATIGFSEVRPLSDVGRIFTIVLIVINLGVFTFALSQLSSVLFDGEIINIRKIKKMKGKIKKLNKHVIVCGFGRNGSEACTMLSRNSIDYVIIEKEIKLETNIQLNPYFLEGDATLDEVLLDAGITNASALITSLPDDANNLFVVLTARELNKSLKIVSRATLDTSVKKLKNAGADSVIMPDKIGGAQMAALIIKPDLKEFIDELIATEDVNLQEIEVPKQLEGKTLLEFKHTFPKLTVLGLKTLAGSYKVNPKNEIKLEQSMKLICLK